jgi:hypothetical protein
MVIPFFKDIRKEIIKTLDEAESDIFVAVYWFTNHELFDKLCEKVREGKKVELIVHNDFINNREAGLNFQNFIDLGGQFYFSDSDNPMHNKFCVIDSKTLINGSYNWTYFAENKNSENILLIKDEQKTVEAFKNEFKNLKQQLLQIKTVKKLSQFELDEFNGLSAKEYLANDIIYEARETNRPEIVETAFKLSPDNIKVQQTAVRLDLTKKRKLKCSIGASLKGNKYLVGVEKGTTLPVSISRIVYTSEDNQVTCGSTLYYGDNDLANMNKTMPGKGSNGKIGGVVVRGLPPKPEGETELKFIFTIDLFGSLKVRFYSLENGMSDYFLANVNGLLAEEVVTDNTDESTT